MSKYDALADFLLEGSQNTVVLTFSQIEHILGRVLPASARIHREWWANGGHTQAKAWLSVGYRVEHVAQADQWVRFCRSGKQARQETLAPPKHQPDLPHLPVTTAAPGEPPLCVCGIEFTYAQTLIPQLVQGKPAEFYPERHYDNRDQLPLLYHGRGPFCHFHATLPSTSGVYLWVVGDEIIYIGEAVNLNRRFNMGYGNISPRNCYRGGQSTNCKMNKVVLKYHYAGTPVKLYIHQTKEHKELELHLLRNIRTKYNVKDN